MEIYIYISDGQVEWDIPVIKRSRWWANRRSSMSERKLSKKRWGSASGSPVEFKFLIDRSIQTRGSFIFIWFVAYCWLHDFDARISIEFATCWFIYRIWQSPLCHANFAHHTFWQRPDATIAQRETLQFSIPQFFLFFFFFNHSIVFLPRMNFFTGR